MNQPPHSPSLFHGRHFDHTVIILCVRWYITYKLSYRDLVEMMSERGVDKHGLTIDFLLCQHRNIAAAKRFFTGAVGRYGPPKSTTLDGYPATHSAVAGLKKSGVLHPQTKVWTSKYLNNLIEQDHRRVKQRIYPMLGFKNFGNAAVTISGIELVQKIKKGQFDTSWIRTSAGASVAHIWEMVIAT